MDMITFGTGASAAGEVSAFHSEIYVTLYNTTLARAAQMLSSPDATRRIVYEGRVFSGYTQLTDVSDRGDFIRATLKKG